MRVSIITYASALLLLCAGVHARLGTTTRRLRLLTNGASDAEEPRCAAGYTCWMDEENSSALWAKFDGDAGGMDCNAVCFSAFAEGNPGTHHMCRAGVPAPKTVNGLSAVAQGMNFDCSSGSNRCWGGRSPPTLSGTILVSAGAESSKNCYVPTEDTLGCTEVVDGANCFGERFSSVCPCVAQETTPIAEANLWRLYTHGDYPKAQANNGWQWDLDNLYFYSSEDCSGSPLEVRSEGTTFADSGNAGDWWTPERAFGVHDNRWGGRWDNGVDRNLWIAIGFPKAVRVGCIRLEQFDNYAQHLAVEAVPVGATTWKQVKAVTDGKKGTNTIRIQ